MNENFTGGKIVHVTDRGYGFISHPSFEKNVFFHASTVKVPIEELKVGSEVSFFIQMGKNGEEAIIVM